MLKLISNVDRFFFESERGLFPNTEFVFDLELPADFIPNNSDGEVETFELLPAKVNLNFLHLDSYKKICGLVYMYITEAFMN